MKTKPKKKTN